MLTLKAFASIKRKPLIARAGTGNIFVRRKPLGRNIRKFHATDSSRTIINK